MVNFLSLMFLLVVAGTALYQLFPKASDRERASGPLPEE